jgi:small subunit ribosomal protein S17
MESPSKKIATRKGIVTSNKMDKTIVVAIDAFKTHPKYLKKYLSTKKYKVHDEENRFKEGDVVEFVECRPKSRNKSYQVIYPQSKATTAQDI